MCLYIFIVMLVFVVNMCKYLTLAPCKQVSNHTKTMVPLFTEGRLGLYLRKCPNVSCVFLHMFTMEALGNLFFSQPLQKFHLDIKLADQCKGHMQMWFSRTPMCNLSTT